MFSTENLMVLKNDNNNNYFYANSEFKRYINKKPIPGGNRRSDSYKILVRCLEMDDKYQFSASF